MKKIVNILAQVVIWLGFKLLKLSAHLYDKDVNIKFKPTKFGAVVIINRVGSVRK